MSATTKTEDVRWAQRRATQLRNLYVHGFVTAVLSALCFLIDLVASRDSVWFFWPMLGLAALFAVHGALYAAGGGFLDEGWRDRKAEALLERRLGPPA